MYPGGLASGLPAEFGCQPLRTRRVGRGALQHVLDQSRAPHLRHQSGFRVGRRRGRLDQRDDFVDVRQRYRQPFQDVSAVARLAELEPRAAHDDLAPVLQEVFEKLLEIEQARLIVDQRHHVHAEAVLQLRQLVQVVEDDVRDFTALELDDDAHARLVRLVAQVGNALELLLAHQLADADQQRSPC